MRRRLCFQNSILRRCFLIFAVWDELKAIAPAWWTHRRETKLVEGLHLALNNDVRLMSHGVGFGHLQLESVDVVMGANGIPRQRGRTDIRFCHASDFGPTLVLEFKRLNNARGLRTQYIQNGIYRFVSGQYAPETDFGMMVGLVEGTVAAERVALLNQLGEAGVVAQILSVPMTHAAYGDPSENTPAVDFDTMHNRFPACPAPTIRVGHMLLQR